MYFFYIHSNPHAPLFFFNDTATTEIYTLSLHDALPISVLEGRYGYFNAFSTPPRMERLLEDQIGRAHVCSSHLVISYAVFCLKKKKITTTPRSDFASSTQHTMPHLVRHSSPQLSTAPTT